jgi:hypothetical protein
VDITSEYVAALRSCLTGEGDFMDLTDGLQARDGGDRSAGIFFTLAGAALGCAARRRFPGGYTDAEVVRLVGQARARLGEEGFEIDPLATEATLRGILGDTAAAAHLEGLAMGTAFFPLLFEVLDEEGITADQMDDFLAEVVPLAEAWLAREQSASPSDTRGAEPRSAG